MEKKYVKLVVFDLSMAVLLFVLYSPYTLALRVTDPGIIRPALAIVCAIFIVFALILVNLKVISTRPKPLVQLDPDNPSSNITRSVMQRYVDTDVVGEIARDGLKEIDTVSSKKTSLSALIEAKFAKGSLTYDKFAAVVDVVENTVMKNCSVLANRIQAFDTSEYRRLEGLMSSGAYENDNIPDDIQEEKWQLYSKDLEEMNAIVAANEKLLLELDKFSFELGKIGAQSTEEANIAIVEEIQELAEQAKYYK